MENKNTSPSHERSVEIIGAELAPLSGRIGLEDGEQNFSHQVTAEERESMFSHGSKSVTITEKEAIEDYFNFLGHVKEEAQSDTSEEGQHVLGRAERFAEQFRYLSVEDRREAMTGLLARQIDYLRTNPAARVSFVVFNNRWGKSEGLLAHEAMANLAENGPDVADRVSLSEAYQEQSAEAPVKNVLLDDWSVSGHQIANNLANLLRSRRGIPHNEDLNVEVNLLIARQDQIDDGFALLDDAELQYGVQMPVPVVAYFSVPEFPHYEGPMPSGAHSSVDYGFESSIADMRDYLAARSRVPVRLPYLASIVR